ncbi:MAG: helix-turn-helix transcriptional regulator [Lutibacter sp.]|uniref:helix-turn-helix transcriptional regulator n=1 Tax=Lutibacter sp. TaxID=1925666 RepID=UPI00299F4AE3|nr:helix-turn-helix transcriptional regulator [Lutibacter sp.]MDX1828070.1 helix-turn-helix transcriptional regulator [Lutibacter sp.]
MVNVEEFASRLKLMLNYYEISAAQLADKIEVQRSSISHILSGRNKPSLEFVLKILKAFPEVELYWLLNGKGTFPKVEENAEITSTLSSNVKKEIAVEDLSETNKLQSSSNSNDLAIERIVVFYKNGTFKNYTP